MSDPAIQSQLQALTRRIWRIEQALNLTPLEPADQPPPNPVGPPAPSPAIEKTNPPATTSGPTPATPAPPRPRPTSWLVEHRNEHRAAQTQATDTAADKTEQPAPAGAQTPPEPASPTQRVLATLNQPLGRLLQPPAAPARKTESTHHHQPAATTASRRQSTWEMQLGGRLLAWAGAVIVILAAGFFVKLAYDYGWLNLPPAARCAAAAGLGALLVAAGELCRRWVNQAAAVGLTAAGLGTLYLTAYATFGYFGLVSEQVGFALLVAVAALGIVLTLHGQMLVIGVLSLLGAYGSPLLLEARPESPLPLAAYLTAVLPVGLALAHYRPAIFIHLRRVAYPAHGLLALAWLSTINAESFAWPAVIWLTVWWGVMLADNLWHALRGRAPVENGIVTFGATVALAVGGAWMLQSQVDPSRFALGTFLLAIALVCVAVAFRFGPGLTALQHRPQQAIDRLAVTLWALTGVLVVAAAGVYAEGGERTVVWAVMAVAAVETGRRLPSGGLQLYGVAVLGAALAQLFSANLVDSDLHKDWFGVAAVNIDVSVWSILAATVFAALHAVAYRLRLRGWFSKAPLPGVLIAVAAPVGIAFTVAMFSQATLTVAWLLLAAGGIYVGRLTGARRYHRFGVFFLVIATIKWFLIDALAGLNASGANAPWLLFNGQMVVAIALVALLGWVGWTDTKWRNLAWGAAVAAFLTALSIEATRALDLLYDQGMLAPWTANHAQWLWWPVLWTVGGGAILLTRLRETRGVATVAGVAVLAGAAAWLTVGTLAYRFSGGPVAAWTLLNQQAISGILVAAALGLLAWQAALSLGRKGVDEKFRLVVLALPWVILFWIGNLELDRFFYQRAASLELGRMAQQASFSIHWALWGVGLVVVGFARRWREVRWIGLGLLVIATGKVLAFDMMHVGSVYRVLSLLVVGVLLIATSVTYQRLAARLEETATDKRILSR